MRHYALSNKVRGHRRSNGKRHTNGRPAVLQLMDGLDRNDKPFSTTNPPPKSDFHRFCVVGEMGGQPYCYSHLEHLP